jgi:hypothetical protein
LGPDEPWQKLLQENEFWQSIDSSGYYESPYSSFELYKKRYDLSLKNKAPFYLSIDFWSSQSKTLTSKRLYVMRTGRGRFVILSLDRFAKPYLELMIDNAKQIATSPVERFDHLKRSFREHCQEDTNLEQLRMLGVYDELVSRVCGTDKYLIGPRGNRASSLKMLMRDKERAEPVVFGYEGQEELDYTIWTDDVVFVFEAKQQHSNVGGLDIGWHKLALPSYRFSKYGGLNIVPVYYLRRNHAVYLFVFPKLHFKNDGIVMNDTRQQVPQWIFRVDID